MARNSGGGTQYQEITPGVGAPQVSGPGGPVRMDVGAAGQGFKAFSEFGNEVSGYVDRLQEIADLNTVAKKTSEHGILATDATEQWKNSLTGANPKEDLIEFNRRMDDVDAKALDGVTGRAAVALKIKLAAQRPVFYEAANRAVGAAGKMSTAATGLALADTATKTAAMMPVAADRDSLFGEQVANFYAAQVANGAISFQEEQAFVKQAWDSFQFNIAKAQAETAPAMFAANWKDGVWEKRLSPEAINKLQPYIQTTVTTNAVRDLQTRFGKNDYAAAAEAMTPEFGIKHGLTEAQQVQAKQFFTGNADLKYTQIQRAKQQANDAGTSRLAVLIANQDIEGLRKMATTPGTPPAVAIHAANLVAAGAKDYKGNYELERQVEGKVLTGAMTVQDVYNLVGPQGLSIQQYRALSGRIEKVSEDDKRWLSLSKDAFQKENPGVAAEDYVSALLYKSRKDNIHGEAILYLGKDLRKDKSEWLSPSTWGSQPAYVGLAEEMRNTQAVSLRGPKNPSVGAPISINAAASIEDRAGAYLRQNGKQDTPEYRKLVIDRGLVK